MHHRKLDYLRLWDLSGEEEITDMNRARQVRCLLKQHSLEMRTRGSEFLHTSFELVSLLEHYFCSAFYVIVIIFQKLNHIKIALHIYLFEVWLVRVLSSSPEMAQFD
jgi:hypothetical protein